MEDLKKNINIFDYEDVVEFLRDTVHLKKKSNAYFSQNAFSNKCKVAPPLFSLVLKKKRLLPLCKVGTISKALKLKEIEAKYLRFLCELPREKSNQRKIQILGELEKIRRTKSIRRYEDKKFDIFSKVLTNVVYVLIESGEKINQDNIVEYRHYLRMDATKNELFTVLNGLEELGLIAICEESGFYKVTGGNGITISSKQIELSFKSLYRSLFERASVSLNLKKDKMIRGGVTTSLTKEQFKLLNEKLNAIREEFNLINKLDESDEIYQVVFCAYPLTSFGDNNINS